MKKIYIKTLKAREFVMKLFKDEEELCQNWKNISIILDIVYVHAAYWLFLM